MRARLTGANQNGRRGIKPIQKPVKGTPVVKPSGGGCGCGA